MRLILKWVLVANLVHCKYIEKTDYYEWRTKGTSEKTVKFPNGNEICRAKITVQEGRKEVFLAGEVLDGKCIVGWNVRDELDDFDVLEEKCKSGHLAWHVERKDLESVLDDVLVHANSLHFVIGICSYDGKNGWKNGNSCQWKHPTPGAQRNEYGEWHSVLTTAECEIKPKKSVYSFFMIDQNKHETELVLPSVPADRQVHLKVENYSARFHSRVLKSRDSSVVWTTGLLKVPPRHEIEVSYHFLTNGNHGELHEIAAHLIHFKKNDQSQMLDIVHSEQLELGYDFSKAFPQPKYHFSASSGDLVAFQMSQTLKTDHTARILTHARITNFKMTHKIPLCPAISPQPRTKLVCLEEGSCAMACRRHFTRKCIVGWNVRDELDTSTCSRKSASRAIWRGMSSEKTWNPC